MIRLIYPENRTVSEERILGWAEDAAANGEIEGGFGTDVQEAVRQLEDAGLITTVRGMA